jgi:hypothetical protein
MKTADWDDPAIRNIGRRWTSEAYDLASELSDYGADASELLKSRPDLTRPRTVTIPTMMADVLQAILLTLPRQAGAPNQPLGENVTALRRRDPVGPVTAAQKRR